MYLDMKNLKKRIKINYIKELKVLKEILQIKEYTPINILNYIKMLDSLPNTCIAYRILLPIHVTCFCKNKFFKIKINKIISKINNIPAKFLVD